MQQYTEPIKVEYPQSGSLTDALIHHAAHQPHTPAIVRRDGEVWTDLTSVAFLEEVRAVAKGLMASGVKAGDRVAIMSRTRFDWTISDYAIWFCGAVTVPVYETSSHEQLLWIMSDSGAVAALVETENHRSMIEEIRSNLPDLQHTWVYDSNALGELRNAGSWISDEDIEARRRSVTPESTATLIYTSGTTGRPKGCDVTHGNFMVLVRNVIACVPEIFADRKTSTLLFLPLAHVFGRIIEIAMVESGLKVAFAPDITNLVPDLAVFRPNFILAVPRVFEKVFNGAQQKATADGKEKIFNAAAAVAIAYSKAIEAGSIPASLKLKHKLFDVLVYGKIRDKMGGRVEWSVSGGAALGSRLGHFFRGIGLTILEGYGLTETASASTVNIPTAIRVGTVGKPLPGVTIAIAEDGEVLVKGKHIFRGYWKNPEATAEAIDGDGWFHTGDIGNLSEDGFLSITGRKKEIIVTAGGKNVAPAVIEDRLRAHWLVSQCMVVGDNKPYIGCVITIDREALPQWLARNNRSADSTIEQLRNDAEFVAEIQSAVDHANKAVSKAESIRKWVMIDADWTEASGHLTPSMKLRRNIVEHEYTKEIASIYDN
ncbi:MAG: hypothetical protein RLZZ426_970 [Actinomycetota bacterium]